MKATDPKSQLLLALAHLGPLSEAALWRKSARSNSAMANWKKSTLEPLLADGFVEPALPGFVRLSKAGRCHLLFSLKLSEAELGGEFAFPKGNGLSRMEGRFVPEVSGTVRPRALDYKSMPSLGMPV